MAVRNLILALQHLVQLLTTDLKMLELTVESYSTKQQNYCAIWTQRQADDKNSDLNDLLIKKCYKCDHFFPLLTFLPEESANA